MKTTFIKFSLLIFAIALCINTAFAQLSVSLTVSTYNGYNVSCFGGTNGSITAHPSGGTSPYTYIWSNAAATTTQTLSGIAASYYVVTVTDASHNTATAGVTLREPSALGMSVTSTAYSNGYDVSCYQCFNGSITTTPSGGVGSYTYLWNSGATTQNRNSVGGGTYQVTVTDANGCSKTGTILVTEAPRDEWAMDGNSGSNPSSQYIGTADNTDLIFKTNATERIKLWGNGNITVGGPFSVAGDLTLPSLAVSGDPCTSILSLGPNNQIGIFNQQNCTGSYLPFWSTIGNTLPNNTDQFIGTLNHNDFRIITNNYQRMVVTADGNVGISTSTPQSLLDIGNTTNHGVGRFSVGSADGSDLDYGTSYIGFNAVRTSSDWECKTDGSHNGGAVIYGDINGNLRFVNINNSSSSTSDQTHSDADILAGTQMVIGANGNVGIGSGTNPPSNKLDVSGVIRSEEVRVCLSGCDFVFDKDYQCTPLKELENFIQENKHLPNFASAKEMETIDGVALGQMDSKLLQSIEEIYLHLFEMNTTMEDLAKENATLKKQIELLGKK